MTEYTCKYCHTTFTDNSNLARHQRKAKYCLQIRGLVKKNYSCLCGKQYSRNDGLQRHQVQCALFQQYLQPPVNKEELLLRGMVHDLQRKLTELALRTSQPTTKNTKNTTNDDALNKLQPITNEVLKEHVDDLTLDTILNGAKGYASYAKEYPFKGKLLYSDRSRKKMRYKDANGELTNNDQELVRRFFEAIYERNASLIKAAHNETSKEMLAIAAEHRSAKTNFNGIADQIGTLMDMDIKSQNASRGKDDEFVQEFLAHLAKLY